MPQWPKARFRLKKSDRDHRPRAAERGAIGVSAADENADPRVRLGPVGAVLRDMAPQPS